MAKLKVAFDDHIRSLPIEKRIKELEKIAKTSQDESERWDCVWLAGEIAEDVNLKGPLFERVADLEAWIMKNDPNSIVRHEACYQIAGRNMRQKIPDLVDSGLHDQSALVRHEAIECLAIMRAYETRPDVEKALNDPNEYVKETAKFVLRRLDRLGGEKFDPTKEFKAY